jgi:predicted phage tail protein
MRNIHLHGPLGDKHGKLFTFEVDTAAEAVRALCVNLKGFETDLTNGSWHVMRGESLKDGVMLDLELLPSFNLGSADLHIMPELAGAKSGVGKALMGIAMVGLSFGTFGGAAFLATPLIGTATIGSTIGMIGLSMALTGISSLLAPEISSNDKEETSSLMGGSSAAAREGTGIPLIYGRVVTGGLVISAGLDIDQDFPTDTPLDPKYLLKLATSYPNGVGT